MNKTSVTQNMGRASRLIMKGIVFLLVVASLVYVVAGALFTSGHSRLQALQSNDNGQCIATLGGSGQWTGVRGQWIVMSTICERNHVGDWIEKGAIIAPAARSGSDE